MNGEIDFAAHSAYRFGDLQGDRVTTLVNYGGEVVKAQDDVAIKKGLTISRNFSDVQAGIHMGMINIVFSKHIERLDILDDNTGSRAIALASEAAVIKQDEYATHIEAGGEGDGLVVVGAGPAPTLLGKLPQAIRLTRAAFPADVLQGPSCAIVPNILAVWRCVSRFRWAPVHLFVCACVDPCAVCMSTCVPVCQCAFVHVHALCGPRLLQHTSTLGTHCVVRTSALAAHLARQCSYLVGSLRLACVCALCRSTHGCVLQSFSLVCALVLVGPHS